MGNIILSIKHIKRHYQVTLIEQSLEQSKEQFITLSNGTIASTVQVRIAPKHFRVIQNPIFRNHPRDISRGANHLYKIVLVHRIHNTALNTTKPLQVARYRI